MADDEHDDIIEVLEKKHSCYVLITCDTPNRKGKMNVNMHYSGDPVLAAYLLQGAQTYIEDTELDPDNSSFDFSSFHAK